MSVKRRAALLGISLGSVYYLPRDVPETDLALRLRTDPLDLGYRFAASRMLSDLVVERVLHAGRLHVSKMMKRVNSENGVLPEHIEADWLKTCSIDVILSIHQG